MLDNLIVQDNLMRVEVKSKSISMMSVYIYKIITLLQTSISSELRGRIFGLLTMITTGLTPFGLGLGGVVADLTGRNIPLIYGTCGIILILLSITISLIRPFRRFLSEGTIEIE